MVSARRDSGGPTRAEIIQDPPRPSFQPEPTRGMLKVDYKTIQHHVRILEENGLVSSSETGAYGAVLLLTRNGRGNANLRRDLEQNWKKEDSPPGQEVK